MKLTTAISCIVLLSFAEGRIKFGNNHVNEIKEVRELDHKARRSVTESCKPVDFIPRRNPETDELNNVIPNYTYDELAAAFWTWVCSSDADMQPPNDPTGQWQGGNVPGIFMLSGTYGGSAKRTVTVPRGTTLFFPVATFQAFFDPETETLDDVTYTALSSYLGIDHSSLTEEELVRLFAIMSFHASKEVIVEATLGDCKLDAKHDFTISPVFGTVDINPICARVGTNVSTGYYLAVKLNKTRTYTLRFQAFVSGVNYVYGTSNIFGDLVLDVKYKIVVV